ncbi:RNA-dependent RNA polymerase [Miscanthus yellow fleck virus]|uniref:RNA-dependent RNA polymerase n=1 Tax=Miscanthus yellow fleck virus TaxID=2777538 RepID=A0A7L8YSC8_9VIRU|nr:RNA-dependent RNA polymerase [Miscanthus yellow fleck virus]
MTLKGNGWIIALVLLLLSFPYCACTKPLWDEKKYTAIDSTSSQPLFGWLDTNATVEYQPSDIVSQYIRNKSPNHFSELSYASMFGWIFLKMKVDLQKALSEVPMCLEQFSEFIFDNMKDTSILFLNNLLWIIIKAYMYVVYTSLYWIGRVFLALWKPLSAASVVLGISTGIYKIILKVYSAIPVFWIFLPITLPVKMSLTIKERLFRKNGDEKMVAGFKSFSVPMTPPGHAVLEIIAQDNSHVGYASCIRLKNGEEALLTSAHCCDGDYKVRSFRNGSKIPISEFLMILPAAKIDAVILRGPPEWKSLLGAKAAHFTPANQLNKGPVSLYSYDGDWKMHNAKVVGTDGKFITVLSNTEAGFSGTPYWNGKSIVGVHKGHVFGDDSKNYNLMSPIPPVKGLTAPNFVYESPSLQGDVYKDDDIDELADYAEQVYEKTLANPALWKPKSGKSWWEMVEEEEGLESSKLQGKRPAWPRPRRKTGIHPCQARRIYQRALARHRGATRPENGLECNHPAGGGETSGESNCTEQAPEETRREEISKQAFDLEQFFQSAYSWQETASTISGFRKVGKLPALYYPPKPKDTKWGQRIISEHPEMEAKVAGFGWPKFGHEAEETSLRLQASRWLLRAQSAEKPTATQRRLVIDRTVEAFRTCRTNAPHASASGELRWNDFLKDFREAINSLELDAGIGLPYKLLNKQTHRQMVEDPKLLPVLTKLTWNRLQKMSQVDFASMTPEQLVKEGLCDPIRLFVKGEPHKQSKLDEGRYRLIMSVSLVDQLVARVLFQAQNKREIALWRVIPSKPGFGLSTDSDTTEFLKTLSSTVGCPPEQIITDWKDKIVPTDCSGFDWSVSDWMLEDDMEVRNKLTINNNELTKRLRACWLKCITNSVLCTSSGVLYAQTHPGVQKSGSYNTSSSNSRIRVMAAYHCGADWAIAMGDDALESPNSSMAAYAKLGFKVETSTQLEFCSHVFEQVDLARPLNVNKMLYRLIFGYNPACGNAEVLCNYLQAVASILNELRHDPQLVSTLHQWLVPGSNT